MLLSSEMLTRRQSLNTYYDVMPFAWRQNFWPARRKSARNMSV